MARVNLTDAKVRALQPRAKRFDVQDALLPGLVVHVTPAGHKSFMFKRRFPGSTSPTRRRLGEVGPMSIEQARGKAREWLDLLAKNIDPAAYAEEQRRRAAQQRSCINVFGL